jgi:AbrB family looped-hinge helix DNA binding protein
MLATIDQGGRIVVPKEVRERLGLTPGTRVELVEADGHLEIAPAATPMHLAEVGGQLVAVPEQGLPTLTAEQVRRVVEAQRR